MTSTSASRVKTNLNKGTIMLEELETRIDFRSYDKNVYAKILFARQNLIPIRKLIEELIKQADLEYYQSQLVNDFPV